MIKLHRGICRSSLCMTLLVILGQACSSQHLAPIAERSVVKEASAVTYQVNKGDTLYSIAWRYGLDYRLLAGINGLADPYRIYPGQKLRLRLSAMGPEQMASTNIDWQWPVSSTIAKPFGRSNGKPESNKGVDFNLLPGQSVLVAGTGSVVYAGPGLGGFAYLVIVKHSNDFLSAYSLRQKPEVAEKERVRAGAVLTKVDTKSQMHFEIRHGGRAVDPGSLIPTS